MAKKTAVPKSGVPTWTYVVSAIVALGGLAWTVSSHFLPKKDEKPSQSPPGTHQSATASDGGIAANAAGGSEISFGGPPASRAPTSAKAPTEAASQSASAASGGYAVNAAGKSKVSVNK